MFIRFNRINKSTMRLISGTLRSTPLPWLPVLFNIEPPALRRKAATDKLVEKIVKHDSWPIQPDILNPPLLRLTSRKPLWLDLQPVDIKVDGGITGSRLRWSILTWCVTPQSGSQVSTSLGNSCLCWTVFARNRDTGDLQYRQWSVSLWRDPDDVSWQNWMAAYLGYTLRMRTLFRGWPIIVESRIVSK